LLASGLPLCVLLALGTAYGDGPAPRAPAKGVAPTLPPLLLDGGRAAVRQQAPAPGARPEFVRPPRPLFMSVGLDVLVDGRPLPTVYYRGKTYLPVPRVGQEYEVRIWNHGPRRVAAVLSVDGLSVINGRPASESQPGFVVAPYGSVLIKGWQRSMDTVAAFRFVERGRSYAGLTGRPENVGVIGLVAFEEAGWNPRLDIDRRESAAPAAAGKARGAVGSIGTEYGREVSSGIYYVPFVRGANRRAVTFYYDTAEALRAAGVPVDGTPVPFPRDGEFAPPPPGYQGR
jgi:hypothetical protein